MDDRPFSESAATEADTMLLPASRIMDLVSPINEDRVMLAPTLTETDPGQTMSVMLYHPPELASNYSFSSVAT